jgi:hypothetical protein
MDGSRCANPVLGSQHMIIAPSSARFAHRIITVFIGARSKDWGSSF